MSSAWGHRVVPVRERDAAAMPNFCNAGRRKDVPACGGPIEFAVQYDYVTGRRGRTATSTKYVCAAHANAFAVRWKIQNSDRADL